MYLVDYHTHPLAHGGDTVKPAHNKKLMQDFIDRARQQGIKELGFSDHDRFLSDINWENLQHIKRNNRYSDLKIKLGLEMDYSPDREKEIKNIINKSSLDYTIGSVHRIGNWEVDHPNFIEEYNKRDLDSIYIDYFKLIEKAVSSGLFNIIGHLDLIKVFNFRPQKIDVFELIKPVLKTIRNNNLVIELNTNGLNKPVMEIYPSLRIIMEAYKLGIKITLGSDAHRPERVGENLDRTARLLKEIGFKWITTFNEMKLKMVEL